MKSVLMISPYFPPRKRVGSLRAFKFAKYLKNYGYEPVVVSLNTPSESLSEHEMEALSGVKLYHFSNPFDNTSKRSGSQLTSLKKPGNYLPRSSSSRLSFSNYIDLWFPIDTWLPVLLPQLANILNIVEKHNCKAIWSTGDPWSSHVFARILSGNNDIPWIADFRDPWALCRTRYQNRPPLVRQMDSIAERNIIKSADKVIFTAITTQNIYKDQYPEYLTKFDTIYNSFDLPSESLENNSTVNSDSTKFNILFFGRFRDLSPAYPIMEILHRVSMMDSKILDGVQVSFIGDMRSEDLEICKQYQLLEVFKQIEHVSHDKSLSLLNSANLLLLSTDPGRFEIIPAKLWDYLPSTTPIFSIAPNPEVHDILKSTGRGVSFSPTEIDACAIYLLNYIKNSITFEKIKPLGNQTIKKYSAIETTATLAAIFDSLIVHE